MDFLIPSIFAACIVCTVPQQWQGIDSDSLPSRIPLSHHCKLILDGNSEIGAHVSSNLSLLFELCIWLDREQSQIGFFFFPKRTIFFYACATFSELPSNKGNMHLIIHIYFLKPSLTFYYRRVLPKYQNWSP